MTRTLSSGPREERGPDGRERPYISVVIAVRNGAATLEACLDSVLGQTYPDWELIVIDGASTDGTQEIIRRQADKIAFWVSEPDRGIYNAWNKALDHASGSWMIFLGADDRFADSTVLSRASAALHDAEGPYGVVYGALRILDERGNEVRVEGDAWPSVRDGFRTEMTIPHPATFHHRSLFARRGRFDERFRIAGDYEFLLRELLDRDALFIADLVLVDMALGGISSRPENLARVMLENQRARRMHGLGWGPPALSPAVVRLRSKAAIYRAFGPRVGALASRLYHIAVDAVRSVGSRSRPRDGGS